MIREIILFIKRNGLLIVLFHAFEIYIGAVLRILPGIEGLVLRALFYRMLFKECGPKPIIYPNVYIAFCHKIIAGKRLAISPGTYIDGGGGIKIGDYVMIGPKCVLSTREHSYDSKEVPMCYQPVKYGEIVIGNNVWIGASVFIRRSVTIGDGSVVAAGTIVLDDVPPNCVFAGVPGRVVSYRK